MINTTKGHLKIRELEVGLLNLLVNKDNQHQ